ncbi:BrnT family toxin [Treponema putidum]|uniref:BrnT family toxin n=1 Tax=Treponema putidum TaxID=221027 RepID=UPI0030B8AAFC
MTFEWDKNKNEINIRKHNVSFEEAQEAFFDKNRVILYDERHSDKEKRYFCLGKVEDKILTIRFTLRNDKIKKNNVKYQTMINEILSKYAKRYRYTI